MRQIITSALPRRDPLFATNVALEGFRAVSFVLRNPTNYKMEGGRKRSAVSLVSIRPALCPEVKDSVDLDGVKFETVLTFFKN